MTLQADIAAGAPLWDQNGESRPALSGPARKLADDLFARAAAGEFAYGARLPSERALCAHYGQTRNAVRQALAALERAGVIERRRGSGSVLRYRPPSGGEDPFADLEGETSPLAYSVVRSIVEPEIVRLAVLNMTSRNIERMNALRAALEAEPLNGEAFARADDALRRHLAESAGNPLLLAAWRLVERVGAGSDWAVKRRAALSPGRIREQTARARALCAAIENRDIDLAAEHVRLALADFHQELVRAG